MRRTAFSRLAAYFGDLVALTGTAALAVDLASGGPALNLRTIADLSLVGAGLCAHRVTASSLREGPALGLAFLVIGAAPQEKAGSASAMSETAMEFGIALGFAILISSTQLKTPFMFAAITIISVIGVLSFYLVALLERLLIPWQEPRDITRTVEA